MDLKKRLNDFPFIAILRGIKPTEIIEACHILIKARFNIIEIPLNSPDPIKSIHIMTEFFGSQLLIGAGTVINVSQVDQVADAGGKLIVSPNCNPDVIKRSKSKGMICLPGIVTPTEAFTALGAGADGLKIFPAEMVASSGVKAMNAILPTGTIIIPVGGIDSVTWKDFIPSGATGFGLGSSLYKADMTMEELHMNAEKFTKSQTDEP